MILKKLLNHFKILWLRYQGRPARLRRAISRATRLHKETGKRYRVFFFGGRYLVWSRSDIRYRIKNKLFHQYLKAGSSFDTISFFDTNSLHTPRT